MGQGWCQGCQKIIKFDLKMSIYKSHGSGKFKKKDFAKIGQNVIFEPGALVFYPENMEIGSNVYIGHHTVLNGYFKNKMIIGDNVWIGRNCFLHSAGGLAIGSKVGIAPGVEIISAAHDLKRDDLGPIIDLPIKFRPVKIEDKSDIGVGAIILPGVTIAEGTQVGAGAVVTKDTDRYTIVAGVPARKIGVRQSVYEKKSAQSNLSLFKVFLGMANSVIRYFFDGLFFLFYPLLVIYSWSRYGFKRWLKLKPSIIVSPFGLPLPFYAVRAIRTERYQADNLAFVCHSYFRPISFGLIVSDHRFLHYFTFLTDRVFLFCWAIFKYDIFECPFSGGILMYSHLRKLEYFLLKLAGKKISVYGYGSDCKILSEIRNEAEKLGIKYHTAMDRIEATESNTEKNIRANLWRAQKYADVLLAAGDLIHLGPKSIMLPLAADLSLWLYQPPPKNKLVTIIHATNHRSHKGSRFILDIVSRLEKKLPVKMVVVEKKTLSECQKIYPTGDIFITDVVAGWHGFAGIEAMAIGRPVISYRRADMARFHHYYAKNIPVVSANPDNLAQVVTSLVRDRKLREDLGRRGRQYVLKYHSFEFVGKLRAIIYEYIWQSQKINQKIFEKEVRKRKLVKFS